MRKNVPLSMVVQSSKNYIVEVACALIFDLLTDSDLYHVGQYCCACAPLGFRNNKVLVP